MRPWPNRQRRRDGRKRTTLATAVAIIVTFLGLWSTIDASAAMPPRAEPFVDCVYVDTNGTQIALFGYTNPDAEPYTPSQNNFSPGAGNQGQPTTLQPGTHRGVVSVTFTGSSIKWHLDSNKATASVSSSPTCASNPAVPEAATVIALPLIGAAIAGLWWKSCERAAAGT